MSEVPLPGHYPPLPVFGLWQKKPCLLPVARSEKPGAENTGTRNFILGLFEINMLERAVFVISSF